MRVYTSDMSKEKIEEFKKDIQTGIACGYNIKKYDLIILKGLMMNFTPHQLYVLSELIINKGATANVDIEHMRIMPFTKGAYKNCEAIQDLLDDSTGSLKDKEAALESNNADVYAMMDTLLKEKGEPSLKDTVDNARLATVGYGNFDAAERAKLAKDELISSLNFFSSTRVELAIIHPPFLTFGKNLSKEA